MRFLPPLQSPFLSASLANQALSNKSDVKLVGGRGGMGERERAAARSYGSGNLQWVMKTFAEFLRLS